MNSTHYYGLPPLDQHMNKYIMVQCNRIHRRDNATPTNVYLLWAHAAKLHKSLSHVFVSTITSSAGDLVQPFRELIETSEHNL